MAACLFGQTPWGHTPFFTPRELGGTRPSATLCWRSSSLHRNYRDCYDYLEQHHQLAPRPFDVIGVEVAVQLKVGVLHLSLDIPEDSKQLLFFTKPREKNNSQDGSDIDAHGLIVRMAEPVEKRLSELPTWKGGGRGRAKRVQ